MQQPPIDIYERVKKPREFYHQLYNDTYFFWYILFIINWKIHIQFYQLERNLQVKESTSDPQFTEKLPITNNNDTFDLYHNINIYLPFQRCEIHTRLVNLQLLESLFRHTI